jgi:predicted amidohydrolase
VSDLRISLVQMEITDGEPARNLGVAAQLIEAHPGADLYLLPELWSSGYAHKRWPTIAEQVTPATLETLKGIAAEQKALIGGTLVSLNGDGRLVNRFWLMSKDGAVARYDKAHLFQPMDEPRHLVPGAARERVRIGSWTAALSICYDLRFPEMYRRDAVDGADLFLVPSEWPVERADAMHALAVARAIENQAYLALTNRVGVGADGTRFGGGSVIVGPGGEIVVSAGVQAGVVTGVIDFSRIAGVRGPLAHYAGRRPGVDY